MSATRSSRPEGGRSLFSVAQIQHVLRIEFGRAQRYRYPLVCLVLSIDQLGALHDRHGYDAKEALFDAVVDLLEEATRGSDFLGRTADDRLLAIIPHTGREGARTLAERLIRGVRTLELPAPLTGARVTLSIGATSNEREGLMYHDALMVAAEAAHAEAASAGGDRFVEKDP